MAEKPLLMSGEMVRATLSGQKTHTRRIFKPQPIECTFGFEYDGQMYLSVEAMKDHLFNDVYGAKGSPYGSIYGDGTADTLWIRETWQAQNHSGQWWHEVPRDSRDQYNWSLINRATPDPDLPMPPKWMPSIFMPRWASRLTLRLTDIRIERLHEASLDDIKAEGCPAEYWQENNNGMSHAMYGWWEHLWDGLNARRGYPYKSNPWVWVVEFEAVTR